MNNKTLALTTALLLAPALGCSFMARGPEDYAKDTQKVLAKDNDKVRACYDEVRATDPSASGKVTVTFTVEKQTGTFNSASIVKDKTTAPDALASCVLSAVEGKALTPEDARDGIATFVYEFDAPAT